MNKTAHILIGVMGLALAALTTYIAASSNVEAQMNEKINTAQKPVMVAIQEMKVDIRTIENDMKEVLKRLK